MSIQSVLYRKGAVSVTPTEFGQERCREIARSNVAALVVRDGEALLGVISEREIVNALARHWPAIRWDIAQNYIPPKRLFGSSEE